MRFPILQMSPQLVANRAEIGEDAREQIWSATKPRCSPA
jgi:hypothetical protein